MGAVVVSSGAGAFGELDGAKVSNGNRPGDGGRASGAQFLALPAQPRNARSVLLLQRLAATTPPAVIDGLQHLLLDSVAGGASVGFLAALDAAAAAQYWRAVLAALGPELALWVAEQDGQVVGTVQLAFCPKPNGRHRAEVQKLLVLSTARGRGIASQLLATAEAAARQAQRTLLVLDTETGSAAESLYVRRGWQKAGEIPNYARSPDGTLHATSYFYKLLTV